MILGRTNTPEFGLCASTEPVLFGPTRNPWDPTRTAGGSSGGSAAAVAARMVPIAHASDGGGSIRIPAACCGLFGLKATRGRNSLAPYAGESVGGCSVEHVVSRSVRDSAAVLDATAGPAPGDPYFAPPPARPFLEDVGAAPGRLRIALATAPFNGMPVDPACVRAAEAAASFAKSWAMWSRRRRPRSMRPARPALQSGVRGRRDRQHPAARPGARPRARAFGFERITWADDPGSRAGARPRLRPERQPAARHQPRDRAVLPDLRPAAHAGAGRVAGQARRARHDGRQPRGLPRPAVAVHAVHLSVQRHRPAGDVGAAAWADGLPVGVQFVGRYGDEAMLFRLAAQLEAARPWAQRRPPEPVQRS